MATVLIKNPPDRLHPMIEQEVNTRPWSLPE